jgi:hypothetical protein
MYYLYPDGTLYSTEEYSLDELIFSGHSDDCKTISDEAAAEIDPSLTDYKLYRGKCYEYAAAAAAADPSLTLVRGHYVCPLWGRQPHWWCQRGGEIIDPTAKQFPSKGIGEYIPFDGMVECEVCGKIIPESEAMFAGRYPVCSSRCYGDLVGVPCA